MFEELEHQFDAAHQSELN